MFYTNIELIWKNSLFKLFGTIFAFHILYTHNLEFRMKNLALILTVSTFIACGEKESDTFTEDSGNIFTFDPTDDLESPGGCSDFLFFDRNADDSILLHLQGQGLAESAHASGESVSVTYDISELPDDIQLLIKFGTNLSHELCNDAPYLEVTVDDSYIPVNGTLTLTVTPNGDSTGMEEFPADLNIQILNSDFCADIGNGETHHENCFGVDSYTATAFIGWLPG